MPAPDPYGVLGVSPQASDAELRAAHRRLARALHPDHNDGSPESARRFVEVQEAYTRALELRRSGLPPSAAGGAVDPALEERIAALERELAQARRAQPAAPPDPAEHARRPTPEELGYVTTDDSFGAILDDLLGGGGG